jgi:ATP-binding cassette subfamily C protein
VPAALVLVVPPLVLALAMFVRALPTLARRERELLLAEERIAARVHTLAAGMRDVVACGAEDRMAADAGRDIEAEAAATAAMARTTALRTIAVGIGGRLPLVLILVGTPWLLANGATLRWSTTRSTNCCAPVPAAAHSSARRTACYRGCRV